MVRARAWYVHGRQIAFPYGERLVSGPFEEMGDAFDEAKRLRDAGLYPDATLDARPRRAKSLPTCSPRTRPPGGTLERVPGYNLRKRGERERAANDIAERARALGAQATIENWDGEPDVDIAVASLHAQIWCVTVQGEMPIISWYAASYPLRGVPGAWHADDVNSSHRRKATSLPATWPELFVMLETGLLAAIDGSAFQLEEPA